MHGVLSPTVRPTPVSDVPSAWLATNSPPGELGRVEIGQLGVSRCQSPKIARNVTSAARAAIQIGRRVRTGFPEPAREAAPEAPAGPPADRSTGPPAGSPPSAALPIAVGHARHRTRRPRAVRRATHPARAARSGNDPDPRRSRHRHAHGDPAHRLGGGRRGLDRGRRQRAYRRARPTCSWTAGTSRRASSTSIPTEGVAHQSSEPTRPPWNGSPRPTASTALPRSSPVSCPPTRLHWPTTSRCWRT